MNSRDIFTQNLKAVMKQRKVSRKELAEGLNIPYTTLTDWCTGRIFPRVEKINLIANYFHIKKSDLLEKNDDDDDCLSDDVVLIDIFSRIPYGEVNSFAIDKYKVCEEILPPEWIRTHNNYFGYIMDDVSMEPEIHRNDWLIIKEENEIEDEGLYCISENNEDGTIRKVIPINDGIMVIPLNANDKYKVKTYTKYKEDKNIKIVGKVVQLKRNFQ